MQNIINIFSNTNKTNLPSLPDFNNKSNSLEIQTPSFSNKLNQTPLILKEPEDTHNKNLLGIFYIIISVFLFSVSNLISKYLSINHPKVENLTVNLIRGLYLTILSFCTMNYKEIDYKEMLKKDNHKTFLLLVRCLFGASSNILLFESFKYMRISSAFTIFCTYPIFVSIISILYLKTAFSRFDIVSYLACILSVVFISKPAFIFTGDNQGNDSFFGVLIAISAACMNGTGICINKYISKDFGYLIQTFFFGIWFTIESLVFLPFTEYNISTLTFTSFFYISILSVLFYIGLGLFFVAINIANPVKILPGTYCGIVFSLIYNSFIFGKPTDFLDITGSFLIILFNTLGTLNIKF